MKTTMNVPGVYLIRNIKNNKIYIGSSKKISIRWIDHKKDLNKGIHSNSYFQRAWNKDGSKNFTLEILEICINDRKRLIEREQYWLDIHQSYKRKIGYNLAIFAHTGSNPSKKKCIVKNCKDKYLASNLCNRHYRRFRKFGKYDDSVLSKRLPLISNRGCKVKECLKPHDSHGYCGMHKLRVLKYNDPYKVKKILDRKKCLMQDCKRIQRGFNGLCSRDNSIFYYKKKKNPNLTLKDYLNLKIKRRKKVKSYKNKLKII